MHGALNGFESRCRVCRRGTVGHGAVGQCMAGHGRARFGKAWVGQRKHGANGSGVASLWGVCFGNGYARGNDAVITLKDFYGDTGQHELEIEELPALNTENFSRLTLIHLAELLYTVEAVTVDYGAANVIELQKAWNRFKKYAHPND